MWSQSLEHSSDAGKNNCEIAHLVVFFLVSLLENENQKEAKEADLFWCVLFLFFSLNFLQSLMSKWRVAK